MQTLTTYLAQHHSVRKKNGFTLLELLIAVSIILVLSTIAVPRLTGAAKTAKIAKVRADIQTINHAAALYEADTGDFPKTLEALVTKDKNGNSYLQVVPKTPDGKDYTIADGVITGEFDGKPYSSTDQPTSSSTETDNKG
jgi:type II secretion system protein G